MTCLVPVGLMSTCMGASAHAQDTRPGLMAKSAAKKTVRPALHADPTADTPEAERIDVHALRPGSAASAVAEQRRSTSIITVLSREQIEQAPQTNLSDILTRLPGVSAYSGMSNGQAATGESQYLTIHGLNSSYNAYSLNGERIAPADPATRAVSFDMLAPFGITAVTVSKSTTADMDGDAIGGAIDIRTPTAFDFNGPYHKVYLQGQLNDTAARMGTHDLGGTAQAEFAQRFGHDGHFGVYATGYYSVKNVGANAVSPNNGYSPTFAAESKRPADQLSSLSNQSMKYDIFTSQIKRYGGSLSLNYKAENQEFYFLGTYGQYNLHMDDNQVSMRGGGVSYPNGVFSIGSASRGQYFETNDSNQVLTTQKLGGISRVGNWTFDYDLFNSYGVQSSPNQVEGSMYGGQTFTGPFVLPVTSTTLPRIGGNAASIAGLYNQDIPHLWKTQGRDAQSIADMYGIHADATYHFHNDVLKSVMGGFKISETDRQAWLHPFFHDDNNFIYDGSFFGHKNSSRSNPAGPPVGNIPGQQVDVFGGAVGPFRLLSRSWMRGTTVPYKYANDPNGAGNYTKNDWNANTSSGVERVYAGYVNLNLQAGPVDIHPGFRYEWTEFRGSHWKSNGDDATGAFISSHQSYGEPLPYLTANWRPTSLSVLRFNVRRAFTRPAFGLINGATSLTLDPATNAILAVSQPNPNLKPTTATVFDFSGELYNHHAGMVSASVYYKQIQKFVFTSISGTSNSATLGGNVPTNATVTNGTQFITPQNGRGATLEGIELNAEQNLYFLPGWMKGFGVNGNLTLQHSKAQSNVAGHPNTALPQAPDMMYNLGMSYTSGPARFNLNYNFIDTQLLAVNSSVPDLYLQPTQRLDLSLRYDFGHGITGSFAAQNLLNTPAFWETQGKGKSYIARDGSANGAFVQTGRIYLAGLSGQF